jgi:hypothetical protein
MARIDIPIRLTVIRCEGCEDRQLLIDALAAAQRDADELRWHRNKVIDERDALYGLLSEKSE